MVLVYRAVFSDVDGVIASALREKFDGWLGSKQLTVPESGIAGRGAPLQSDSADVAWASENRSVLANGDRLHRLRLVEENPDDRWTTTAVAVVPSQGDLGASAKMWIDVEHESSSSRDPLRPGSPRLVRELIAKGEAFDGPVPLSSEAWEVSGGQVDEVASWITSPARSIPIVVFAHDAKAAYNQQKLAGLLARDLAGVAAVLRLRDADATDRLAKRLPTDHAVWAGAMRTYLPGVTSDPDNLASRHRVLGRTTLVALGPRAFPAVKDQILALSVRQTGPLVRPAAVVVRDVRTQSAHESPRSSLPPFGPGWIHSRLRRMRAALGIQRSEPLSPTPAETIASFDEALDALIEQSSRDSSSDVAADSASGSRTGFPPDPDLVSPGLVDGLRAELQRERDDRTALEELLDETQQSLETQASADRVLRVANEDLTIEVTESAEEVDGLERQVRYLQRRVRELGESGVGTDDTLPTAPASVAEVLVLAREHLPGLQIADDVDRVAAELDLHARAQLFAVKSWAALTALDAYAQARAAGGFSGSFLAWCAEPPAGERAIAANAVAMVESETVGQSPKLRDARTFRVPRDVHAAEVAYMQAHVKIVRRGSPAPRLHFLDDAAVTGKVYIGYLGPHLPTARFA